MKTPNIDVIRKLLDDGVLQIESRTGYENENRDFAIAYFFTYFLLILPLVIVIHAIVEDSRSTTAWIFFMLFLVSEVWLFYTGIEYYKLHKEPEKVFWKYFIKRYLKLVFLATVTIDGADYVVHSFINQSISFRSQPAYFEMKVPKEMHRKAMGLNERGYHIAVDKDGKRKVVYRDNGEIEDADDDALLLAAFLRLLIYIYGADVRQLNRAETEGKQ